MRVTIRGCRGSLASPGPQTLHFGGNTSCVEVRPDDGTLIVLDAGTGIRELGISLTAGAPPTIHVLLTHLHLDHIEGLGFFLPLWKPETELHIWGPPSPLDALNDRIERYMSPPLFPVMIRDAPADVHFYDVPDEPWSIGGATISAQPVVHPGPTVGYRLEADGAALAYLPDHEPALGGEIVDGRRDWISGLEVAEGADLLLHDAQYSEDEYRAHVGWGHSSIAHAVAFARLARARRLLLFHHDPLHSDAGLRLLESRARELAEDAELQAAMAVEGAELGVGDSERAAAHQGLS
jgi:phosphoribosyl 1,2-cyclic phosphodiesterase